MGCYNTQSACMKTYAVRAPAHPQTSLINLETNIYIQWKFHEDLTSFDWDIEVGHAGNTFRDTQTSSDKRYSNVI